MSGSPNNNHSYQAPNQGGPPSNAYYQYPQGGQPPMNPPYGYFVTNGQGYSGQQGLNNQHQYSQPLPSMPYHAGMQAARYVYAAFTPTPSFTPPAGRIMGYNRMGQVLVATPVRMNMSLPLQPPPIAHSQQDSSFNQPNQLNSTIGAPPAAPPRPSRHEMRQQPQRSNGARQQQHQSKSHVGRGQGSDSQGGGFFQFSEDKYQQQLQRFPLNHKVVAENQMLWNLLSGMTRDMVEMKEQIQTMGGRLESLSLPKTDQSTQTHNPEKGNNNVGPPSPRASVTSDSVSHADHLEDSAVGKAQTVEAHRDEKPRVVESVPDVGQITIESNTMVEHQNVTRGCVPEKSTEGKMITENESTSKVENVTKRDAITPTEQENVPKIQYSDLLRVAAASQPTSSTEKTTASEAKNAEAQPAKHSQQSTLLSPEPTTSESLPSAVKTPTDGFEFPKPRKVASSPMNSKKVKAAFAQGKVFESRQHVMKKEEVAAPKPITSNPVPHAEVYRNRKSPGMSNEQLMTALVQGKAPKSLSIVHRKKESPISTPSKKVDVPATVGLSKKQTPKSNKPSPASKGHDQEEYDFEEIQQKLAEFQEILRVRLDEYSSVMWQTRQFGKPTSKERFHPFFDQISAHLQTPVIFDKQKMSENLQRRISSYTDRNDLKSQKMRVLLNLMLNSTSQIVYHDSMFLFRDVLTKKEQDSVEESYLSMIMEFAAWKPEHLVAKKAPYQSPSQNVLSDFNDRTKVTLSRYADLISISRLWDAAFVKGHPQHHPLQNTINDYLRQLDPSNQTLKDKAAENMQHRLALLDNQTTLVKQKMHVFFALLSGMEQSCIRDDVLFLFSEERADLNQTMLELSYFSMIVDSENWLVEEKFELVPTDFADFPVKLARNHLNGFIMHVNLQCKLRNRLGEYKASEKMKKAELFVFRAFESSGAGAETFSTKECRAFLLKRKNSLEGFKPRSAAIQLYINFYDFLIHVDSNIINFDAYYFKKSTEAKESVVPLDDIANDEAFFVHVFRLLPF